MNPMIRILVVAAAAAVLAIPLSARPAEPRKVGQCVNTTVSKVGTRLQDSRGNPVPGSGTSISFANGVGLVSYDTEKSAEASRVGDRVTLCLYAIPSGCPPGDTRGRTYTVSNKKTKKKFSMLNSQHSCGGA